MRVTACRPSGYGAGYGDTSKHEICREEYQVWRMGAKWPWLLLLTDENHLKLVFQTQQYSVPLVNVPLVVSVEVAAPEPVETCVTKVIKITEVVCKDIEEKKCFNVAKFEDGKNTIDQVYHKISSFPESIEILTRDLSFSTDRCHPWWAQLQARDPHLAHQVLPSCEGLWSLDPSSTTPNTRSKAVISTSWLAVIWDCYIYSFLQFYLVFIEAYIQSHLIKKHCWH